MRLFIICTDYVEEVYQTFLEAERDGKLSATAHELKEMTPAPMNTMLEKQPREEANQKWQARKRLSVENVPPTTPGKVTERVKTLFSLFT